ncbi:hypothetical protein [Chthonobacter albigriseus]|uniref:hypothetical protein n=1 Tax=Chthonobacter albigriseus TaxID=1683161 RepID=UPI0015EF79F0|nr:hypothetical protein [Chthonobacter albigriseus]
MFRGLWRRLSIEWGDGRGDVATTVFWLQTEAWYCDIRLPVPRPAAGARGFADLTVADAVALAGQEAFAGVLTVEGDVCTWARQIDFAPTGVIDRGHAARRGRMLVETGTDAAYVEHWWQDIEGPLPTLEALQTPATGAIAVRVGDTVMTAMDRRPARPAPGILAEKAAEAAGRGDARALADLLDCEVAMGTLGASGTDWVVELSTLPWLVGERRQSPFPPAAGDAA